MTSRKLQVDRKQEFEKQTKSTSTAGINHGDYLPIVLRGVLGYGLLIGWQTVMIWSTEIVPLAYYSDLQAHIFRAVFLATISLVLIVLSVLPRYLDRKMARVVIVVIVAICAPLAPITMRMSVSISVAVGSWVLSGIANALLLALWCIYLVSLNQRQSLMVVGSAFFVAGLSFLFFIGLRGLPRFMLASLIPLLSLSIFLTTLRKAVTRVGEYHKKIDLQPEKKFSYAWERNFSMVCNVFTGFSASCLTSSLFSSSPSVYIGLALAVSGVVICTVLFKIQKNTILLFIGILLPFMAVQFFAFAFGSEGFQVLATIAMFFFMSCFDILNTSSLSRKIRFIFADYEKRLMRCRAFNRVAFSGGWLVGLAAIYGSAEKANALIIVSFILFGFLAVSICITLFQLLFASRKELPKTNSAGRRANSFLSAPSSVRDEGNTDAACGIYTRKSSQIALDNSMTPALFELAAIHQLTPREEEIFEYLARGRDVKFISAMLVLSTNTVRSHIYSIYAKLGVHSKQELINTVEQRIRDTSVENYTIRG